MIELTFPTLYKAGLISRKKPDRPVYRSTAVDIAGAIILTGRYKAPKKPRKPYTLKSPFYKRGPMTREQLLKYRRRLWKKRNERLTA